MILADSNVRAAVPLDVKIFVAIAFLSLCSMLLAWCTSLCALPAMEPMSTLSSLRLDHLTFHFVGSDGVRVCSSPSSIVYLSLMLSWNSTLTFPVLQNLLRSGISSRAGSSSMSMISLTKSSLAIGLSASISRVLIASLSRSLWLSMRLPQSLLMLVLNLFTGAMPVNVLDFKCISMIMGSNISHSSLSSSGSSVSLLVMFG